MINIIIDTIVDSLKLIPFLFLAFLLIELFEHKLSKKSLEVISKSGKLSPLIGSLLGAIPQCGFSVIATNLYVTRIISLGTLISIYLSTSDELIPVLISNNYGFKVILPIILIKVIIGFVSGFIIDIIYQKNKKMDYHICADSNCDCQESLIKSSIIHTLKTLSFIFIITFILNTMFYYLNENIIRDIIGKSNFLAPFISSLIGLIPNCGSSVMISELYIHGILSLGSTLSGLLTGSGVALLVLFKSNKNVKENISILLMIYFIGIISGIIINLIR